MKKIIKIIALVACLVSTSLFTYAPLYAKDDSICDNKNVPAEVRSASGCDENAGELDDAITGILNSIIGVSGLVAVVFVLIGGFNYMASAGNTEKLEKAKKTIIYACIGLVVCALAFAIVNWAIYVIGGKA